MNFDHTELVKNISKDNLCFNYLQHVATYNNGAEKFHLKGINNLELIYNEHLKEITLNANFPYFWQGHNFSCNKNTFTEAIQFTSESLNLNIYEAEIKRFEFGSIVETDFKADVILLNHINYDGKQMQPFYKGNKLTGKTYQDNVLRFKMYDAGLNVKNKLPKSFRADLSTLFGYNDKSNYIKIENHYRRPDVYFKERKLYLNEILSEPFMANCKSHLINNYKQIMKTGIVDLPKNKKDINSATIPLMAIRELELLFNVNIEKQIMQKIDSIPDDILNKFDKKSRKRQIKANLKKIECHESSIYDLSELLIANEIN